MHSQMKVKREPEFNAVPNRSIINSNIDTINSERLNLSSSVNVHDFGKRKNTFYCKTCEKEFLTEIAIRFHVQSHYMVESQPNILAWAEPLDKTHKYEENYERKGLNFICNICSKKYLTKISIRLHLRTHAFNSIESTNVLALDPLKQEPIDDSDYQQIVPIECDIKSTTILNDNTAGGTKIETKSPEKPYKCHVCLKTFVYKKTMEHHISMHKSNVCNKPFTRENAFNLHMRNKQTTLNDDQIPYKCSKCGKAFRYQTELNEHIQNCCNQLKCDICQCLFEHKYQLKLHMAVHSNDKQYECDMCHEQFGQLTVLKVHIVREHNSDKIGSFGSVTIN